MKCAFTGHRPDRFSFKYDESDPRCAQFKLLLKDTIRKLYEMGADCFISGMALGSDLFLAESVLELKNEGLDLCLECAVPYRAQSEAWPRGLKYRYNIAIEAARRVIYISEKYVSDCFYRRNEYLVAGCDILLAVYDGSYGGGTYQTIELARKRDKEIVIIKSP